MKQAKTNQPRTTLAGSQLTRNSRSAIRQLPKWIGSTLLTCWFRSPAIAGMIVLATLTIGLYVAQGADQTWGANGNSAWYTNTNWAGGAFPGLQGAAASNTDSATWTSAATGTTFGINMGTASLNLGAIVIDSTRSTATNIGNSSVTGGSLRLYGKTVNAVPNVIVRHNGTGLLTLQIVQSGNMAVVLSNATDNIINIDNTGGVTISSAMSGSGMKLTKAGGGAGTLTLSGANTYSGDTTISTGKLALTAGGSIANSPNIIVAGGATFDVSALTAAFTTSTQTLKASGSGSTGTIATTTSKGLSLTSTAGLQFTAYNGSTAPLTVTGAGSITLAATNAAVVTVPGSALAAGDYKLIASGGAPNVTAVNGTAPSSVTVNGAGGLAAGTTASLVITGGELFLHVVNAAVGSMVTTLPGQTFTSGSGNSGVVTAQTAGTPFNLTLTATLADGVTKDTSYSGTKTINYSGPGGSPTYTTSVNFTSGQATGVSTTLTLAQTTTITATDGTLTGVASSSLTVNPGAINSYVVSASSPQNTSVPFSTSVTAKDANNNTVTTDSSTVVTMTSGSGNMQFDSNGDSTFGDNTKTLASGAFTISTKDDVAETTTITATDTNSKTGTSGSIVVQAPPKYRSRQTGNWNDFNSWQVDTGGGFVDAIAGQTPTSADDTVQIRTGHVITVTANVAVDQVTIDLGGQVSVNSGVTFTIANGTGTDLIVNGIVGNAGTITPTGTISFNSGSKYQHNFTTTAGTIPTSTWDGNSTVEILGYTSNTTVPGGISQSFGNFTWNCPLQTGNLSFAGAALNASGTLTMTTTNSGSVRFGASTNGIWTVGNYTQTGGTIDLSNGTGSGTLRVAGTFNQSGGTITETGSGTADTIEFNGSTNQSVTAGTINNTINIIVNNAVGITLGSDLTVNGTLTLTLGQLDVSTRVLTLNGDTAVSSGTLSAASGTVNYFQTANGQHVIAANYFLLAFGFGSGSKILPAGTVGIEDTFNPSNTTGHTITGNTIDYRKATGSQNIAAFNYNNLSNSGGGNRVLPGSGTVGIAGVFSPGGGIYTVTGSTVEYNGTSAQTMPNSRGFTYNNLSINNAAGVTAPDVSGQTVLINQTLALKNGAFTLASGNGVTMADNSTIDRSGGSISATPAVVGSDMYNVTYSGSATLAAGPEIPASSSVLRNLTLSQSAGDVDADAFGSNITVNGTLTMSQDTDLDLGSNILVMGAASAPTTAGTGQGEVVGKVRRTSFTSTTSYSFGSPFVQFGTFTYGVAPTQIDVTMTPERPLDFSQAVKRTYQIDVTGGVAMTTTLRLHYRDGDALNGNDENTLDLWEGPTWTDQLFTTRSASDNWVERAGISTFSPWTLGPAVVPNAVKLTRFNAVSYSDGVQLTWASGFEVNNLGYRLYREQQGKRSRVTPSIVAGSALKVGQGNKLTAGYSYSWFDPQGTPDTLYYLEAIDLNGEREMNGPVYPYASGRGTASPKLRRAMLLNEVAKSSSANSAAANAAGWPTAMPLAARSQTLNLNPQTLAAQQAIAAGKAIKIQVSKTGWYRLTQPELVAAGFDPSADARLLQLFVDGVEVPVRLSSEGARLNSNDTIEFYGVALDTLTTDAHTYWLIDGNSPGKRISAKRGKIKPGDQNWTDGGGLRSFAYTVERRDKLIYSPRLLNGDAENIFGALIFTEPTEQTLTVRNIDREAPALVQLEVALQGLTAQDHDVQVMLNGTELGTMSFGASEHSTAHFSFKRALLQDGDNLVTLASRDGDSDISLVDYLRLTYPRQYTAENNALRFSVPGGGTVRVDGFTNANIRVIDITNPEAPLEVATVGSPANAGYGVKIQALAGDTRSMIAFADDLAGHPDSITANKPSSWNASSNGADLVVITHKNFRSAIEPLVSLRRNQGLSVAVVDVEDIYDEFSYGEHTPAALKGFLSWAASHWSRKPAYLLLVGDSSWDPRNYMDQGANDFVPTKLIDTGYMETASDDWLVDFSGNDVAQMAVGRLPGRTAPEVSLMVSKILAYEQEREVNAPLRGAVMVADSGFETVSAETRALLPSNLATQTINRAEVGNDDVMRGQLLDALNQGPTIVNFYGHGSVDVWTSGGVLDSISADSLTNVNRSSIYLMMTCLNGYASDAYIDSLSESVLKAQNGGAVAVWASSGFTPTNPQFAMNTQFYRLLFGGQALRLGEAAREAKQATTDRDVRRTWMLFGDPTMRVR